MQPSAYGIFLFHYVFIIWLQYFVYDPHGPPLSRPQSCSRSRWAKLAADGVIAKNSVRGADDLSVKARNRSIACDACINVPRAGLPHLPIGACVALASRASPLFPIGSSRSWCRRAGRRHRRVARVPAQEMAKDLGVSRHHREQAGRRHHRRHPGGRGAAADGYTLLMGTFANAVNPSLNAKLPYDVHRDFAPVALIARASNIVVVNPESKIKSIADLIAVAKAAPGRTAMDLRHGTSAHLGGEWSRHRRGQDDDGALQGRGVRDHRPDRRPDRRDLHDGGQRRVAGRGWSVARHRRDVGRTPLAFPQLPTVVGSRSFPATPRKPRQWPRRGGPNAARDHRPPGQVGGESLFRPRHSGSSVCQRRPGHGGRAAGPRSTAIL